MPMTARVIVASSTSVVISSMNERSIFSASMGKRLR